MAIQDKEENQSAMCIHTALLAVCIHIYILIKHKSQWYTRVNVRIWFVHSIYWKQNTSNSTRKITLKSRFLFYIIMKASIWAQTMYPQLWNGYINLCTISERIKQHLLLIHTSLTYCFISGVCWCHHPVLHSLPWVKVFMSWWSVSVWQAYAGWLFNVQGESLSLRYKHHAKLPASYWRGQIQWWLTTENKSRCICVCACACACAHVCVCMCAWPYYRL